MSNKDTKSGLNENSRCTLYSPDCLQGKIFTGADAIAAAQADGWVDNPGKAQEKTEASVVTDPAKPTTGGKKAAKDDNSK